MSVMIVNPQGVRLVQHKSLAARPASVAGLTVGLLDNNKPAADVLLKSIGAALVELGAAGVVYRQKSHPAGPSPYIEELAGSVDVAVSALGD